jgi:hypothetical protein
MTWVPGSGAAITWYLASSGRCGSGRGVLDRDTVNWVEAQYSGGEIERLGRLASRGPRSPQRGSVHSRRVHAVVGELAAGGGGQVERRPGCGGGQ